MKNYKITVNGTVYDVEVEEVTGGAASVNTSSKINTPKVEAAPASKKEVAQNAGSIIVSAPMPGKILNIKSNVGASVKKGEVILILEAMKMENEVVAPEDGTIASINVSAGDSVEAGDTLATLN